MKPQAQEAKARFRGLFNWAGETHELWVRAVNKDRAFHLFVRKLAKKVGVGEYSVRAKYLAEVGDNYWVERKEREL